MRDTTFFHFSKLFFYKITVSFTMVIERSPASWWTSCRWRAVNFEIHLWSSGMNADCIWRSTCIQHVQIEAGLNSDPGNDSFWDKSVTLSMLIDLLTSTCRSTQVKIASTDLWPQGMFTFSEMLALVESESSFGAYVCHRRPGGSLATSDLVIPLPPDNTNTQENQKFRKNFPCVGNVSATVIVTSILFFALLIFAILVDIFFLFFSIAPEPEIPWVHNRPNGDEAARVNFFSTWY